MTISNKIYDILKWIAQYGLPAIGTLYFAIANVWGLPYGEEVIGTIAAIDTFLGILLGISSSTYNKTTKTITVANINVETDEDQK
jgi:hypothetical protein